VRIISISNQKGGVGKTTSAINIAVGLAKRDKRVLVIDSDPQGNATTGFGIDKYKLQKSMYHVLVEDDFPLEKAILPTAEGVDIVPSNIQLSGAEITLFQMMSRELKLKDALSRMSKKYDYIIIDCPPSLGLLTINAFAASTDVYVPVDCSYYALEGIVELTNTIDQVKRAINRNLAITGVFLTMYDSREKITKGTEDQTRAFFGDIVFKSVVRKNVKVKESPSAGQSVIGYEPSSNGATDYQALADEIISREQ